MIENVRMRLVGELASGVAHDLNNTLHALSLRIGHLQASQLDAGQKENVEILSRIVGDASCRVTGRRAEVLVEDRGVGIPAENLGRLFDPFLTTKGPLGMGLGLAIAQGVMRRLGGHISAANRPGGGAAFTLTFPICHERPLPEREVPPLRASPGHRLLVVDDDKDNLDAIRWALQDLGQEVDAVASGEEAISLLSSGRRYDLILCDVGMPEMNGWQVAEQVRRLAPEARFLLLTGWAQEIPRDDPKRRLVDGILAKPLDLPGLRRVLDERLGEPAVGTR